MIVSRRLCVSYSNCLSLARALALALAVCDFAATASSTAKKKLCEQLCPDPIYLATSKVWDDDFERRIERHRRDRGDNWTTVEEMLEPSRRVGEFRNRAVLVDCLTLWLTNHFSEEGAFEEDQLRADKSEKDGADADGSTSSFPEERALQKVKDEFQKMIQPWDVTYVFVTNELGSGTHPSTHIARKFVDAQGWLNQHVAAAADCVVHMVCGIPNIIKEPPRQGSASDQTSACRSAAKRQEAQRLDKFLSSRKLPMDKQGYFMVKLDPEKGVIAATFHSSIVNEKGEVCDTRGVKIPCHGTTNRPEPMKAWECRTAKELTTEIFERWEDAAKLVTTGHAAYIGREAQKAEHCLYNGEHYQQD